jgi:peptide deformylase
MMLELKIWPDEILSQVAEPVTEFGPELLKTGQDMIALMKSTSNGVGLAATQVGILKRMFVFYDEASQSNLVAVNPDIVPHGPVVSMQEGCLSLPGIYEQVLRPEHVTLHYKALDGNLRTLTCGGLTARVIQHEVDHLDGKMFFSRLSRPLRKSVMVRWEKACLT